MSSQGETQIRAILGDSLSNTKLLVMFGVFGVAVLIAISIQDNNLKICFWLSLILLIICLINLNLSISFYIKLKDDKGIQGPRGERGDKGPKGFPGRCSLDTGDSIENCKIKILNNLRKTCPNYDEIVSKRVHDRTPEEENNLRIYNQWVNIIDKDCKGGHSKDDEEDYFNKIFSDSSKYCLV